MTILQELLIEFITYKELNRVKNILKNYYLYFNDLINVSLSIKKKFIKKIYCKRRLLKNKIY